MRRLIEVCIVFTVAVLVLGDIAWACARRAHQRCCRQRGPVCCEAGAGYLPAPYYIPALTPAEAPPAPAAPAAAAPAAPKPSAAAPGAPVAPAPTPSPSDAPAPAAPAAPTAPKLPAPALEPSVPGPGAPGFAPKTSAVERDPRMWTDDSGMYHVVAELVTVFDDGSVRLRRDDGVFLRVPLDRLSKVDKHYLESQNLPLAVK